jgi:hypothetical protein
MISRAGGSSRRDKTGKLVTPDATGCRTRAFCASSYQRSDPFLPGARSGFRLSQGAAVFVPGGQIRISVYAGARPYLVSGMVAPSAA